MRFLKNLWRCSLSASYANHNEAIDAMRIARMYGHCSRMENCPVCRGFHVEFIDSHGDTFHVPPPFRGFIRYLVGAAVALGFGFLLAWFEVPGAFR